MLLKRKRNKIFQEFFSNQVWTNWIYDVMLLCNINNDEQSSEHVMNITLRMAREYFLWKSIYHQ